MPLVGREMPGVVGCAASQQCQAAQPTLCHNRFLNSGCRGGVDMRPDFATWHELVSLAKLVGQNALADGFHVKIGRFNVDKP